MKDISVHDNFLISHTVNAEKKEIVLHTVFKDQNPHEYTDVTFSDVVAYHFENDNLRTILFDVIETTVESTLETDRFLLEKGRHYAWPMTYETETELLEKTSKQGTKAFVIESSFGMTGWIWAKEMKTELIK